MEKGLIYVLYCDVISVCIVECILIVFSLFPFLYDFLHIGGFTFLQVSFFSKMFIYDSGE